MKKENLRTFIILLSFILIFACGSNGGSSSNQGSGGGNNTPVLNSLETIIADMELPHEGNPHGVPLSWDWATGPSIDMGSHPPKNFTAMCAWGQLYEDSEGNSSVNTRVQIRDLKAYLLSLSSGEWHLVQDSNVVDGAAYLEDYSGNVNIPADIRNEADGGISVVAGNGYNFHFWPKERVLIDPPGIGGVFVTVEARLVVDEADKPDDRAKARYLLNVGADYWLDLDVGWQNGLTNAGIGMGRFKYVEVTWKKFNMITLTAAEVYKNPPPLE